VKQHAAAGPAPVPTITPGSTAPESAGPRRRSTAAQRRHAGINRWMRWLHAYTSMISLLVVLFFGVTGLTLNHPSWTFGVGPSRSSYSGTLPAGYDVNGTVDFLKISEVIRNKYDVTGEVTDHGVSGNDGRITYNGPGYEAALTFDVAAGTYQLKIDEQGLLGVMNDLHKGRNSSSSWRWVIDVSAILLVLVAFTGLGIQLFQRKRRTKALILSALGVLVTVLFIYIAIS
jgi:hypothetical protein